MKQNVNTLYNTGTEAVTGFIPEKFHATRGHYVELLRDEAVLVNDSGYPQFKLAADSVALLGYFPVLLSVSENGKDGFKFAFDPACGDEIVICENKDDEFFHAPRGKSVILKNSTGQGEYRLKNPDSRKVIFKLKKNGYLVDQIVIDR